MIVVLGIVLMVSVVILLVPEAPAKDAIVIPMLALGLVAMLVQVPKIRIMSVLKVQQPRTAAGQIIVVALVMLVEYKQRVEAAALRAGIVLASYLASIHVGRSHQLTPTPVSMYALRCCHHN